MWMPAIRIDDGMNVQEDWVQIANHTHIRYETHVTKYGIPAWGSTHEKIWGRPNKWFYAKVMN